MTFFTNLPEDATLVDVFKKFPAGVKPLLEYHDALLRGPSPLSEAERELIAAFVSSLNGCQYCTGSHTAAAEAYDVPEGLVSALTEDVSAATRYNEKLIPLLRYVKKLTYAPDGMTQADADAVYEAGWDEEALHHAVCICALFNFMNRFIEGLGIPGNPDYYKLSGERLKKIGYTGFGKMIDQNVDKWSMPKDEA